MTYRPRGSAHGARRRTCVLYLPSKRPVRSTRSAENIPKTASQASPFATADSHPRYWSQRPARMPSRYPAMSPPKPTSTPNGSEWLNMPMNRPADMPRTVKKKNIPTRKRSYVGRFPLADTMLWMIRNVTPAAPMPPTAHPSGDLCARAYGIPKTTSSKQTRNRMYNSMVEGKCPPSLS